MNESRDGSRHIDFSETKQCPYCKCQIKVSKNRRYLHTHKNLWGVKCMGSKHEITADE